MDLEKVNQLLALMEEHNLVEIEVEEGGVKVRLRKNSAGTVDISGGTLTLTPTALMSAAGGPAPAANPAGAPAKAQDTVEIKSPMVGTFYRAAAPEADPFVTIGQEVTEDTTVCIIEAMKVMNEIKAEVRGEVVAVLVENGEPVEFGQPLILLKPIGSASAPSPT